MRIQRKLLIGFLTLASIFCGTLAYGTQTPVNPKTDLVISKDTVNEDIILEDSSLSEPETNPETTSQTPDKTVESETGNLESPPVITNDNITSESAKNTPIYNPPEPTLNTVENQTENSSPVDNQTNNNSVDISEKTTITYEELEEFIKSGNSVTENTPPTDPPESSTTTPSNHSDYANQVLSILNQERANADLSPLTMNQSAVNAASVRAKEIVSNFSHTRPSGQSPFTALDEAGVSYVTAGENIAWGQKTPSDVMTGWMNSSGHRANILNSSFTQVGIACYEDPNSQYGYYWVQLFIG